MRGVAWRGVAWLGLASFFGWVLVFLVVESKSHVPRRRAWGKQTCVDVRGGGGGVPALFSFRLWVP